MTRGASASMAALALLCARTAAATTSILFQNQCGFEVSIFDGDERFCGLRNGTAAAPSFGCATNLPRALAEYSHTGAANATSAYDQPDANASLAP
jgi:hypothetical protein